MAIKSTVELEVKSNLKGFKGEIRQATIEAQEAVRTFGEFSPEAIEAEKRLAQLRDRMEDFNDRVSALNPDKFAQINTVVQGVARGFQAAQGAMALFGSESEDLQKTMVKLQGAMALAEGLEGLGKVQQQFTALANTIKGKVVTAFSTLRGAIIATGIGALGIALGYVATNFEKVSQVVLNFIPGLSKVGEIVKGLVQDFTDFIGITSEAERTYKAFKKSITVTNEELEGQIDLLSVSGDKELEIFKLREKIINNQLKLISKRKELGIKLTEDELEEEARLYRELNNKLAVNDAEREKYVKDKAKEFIKDTEALNDRLVEINEDTANKWMTKNNQVNTNLIDNIYAREDQEKTIIDRAKRDKLAALAKEEEEMLKKYKDIEGGREYILELYAKQRVQLEENYQEEISGVTQKFTKERAEFEIKTAQQIRDAKLSMAQSTVSGLTSLNDILTNEQKKRENIQKGIALVEIAIDSAVAFSSLNAESAQASAKMAGILGPATPIFTASYYAQGVARILANVAKAKQILSGGSGQGSIASPSVTIPQIDVPITSSSLLRNGGNEQLTQQQRVYVLEGDITRTQQRVSNNKKVSIVK